MLWDPISQILLECIKLTMYINHPNQVGLELQGSSNSPTSVSRVRTTCACHMPIFFLVLITVDPFRVSAGNALTPKILV